MSFREVATIPGVKPVLFTLFMVSFGFGVILPILPFYTIALGAKPFDLGLLTATFAFMSLVFSPVMGRLADKAGRKKTILAGTLLFVVAYLIFASADSLAVAFLARALEGVAASAIYPACISLISDFTNERQRGRAMGLTGMAFSLGFIAGPAIGGLASSFAVGDAFLLSAGLAFGNFVSVLFQLKEPREKAESRDLTKQEFSLLSHLSSPLLFLFLSSFMITFMIGGLDATLAIYTGERLGFSSSQVGLIFTYIGVLIMVMQFVSGSLVNRFGEMSLIQAGLLLSGAGFFLLAFVYGWSSLLFPLAVFVAGNALVFPSVNSLITKRVVGKRGAVLGLVSSFSSAGQMVGPLMGATLYGINHDYAFVGMAVAIWSYAIFFKLAASKGLSAS